jgi:hypothetical protein
MTKINVKNLNEVLKTETDERRLDLLRQIHNSMDPYGNLICEHYQKDGQWRMYANGPSLQFVQKDIRRYISIPSWEFDLINAWPTILRNICIQYNIQCKWLDDYVKNRQEWLSHGIDKKDVIDIIFDKDVPGKPILDNFRAEIARIRQQIATNPNIPFLPGSTSQNMSRILQNEEVRIIMKVLMMLNYKYPFIRLQSYLFDGFLLEKNPRVDPQKLLIEMNQTISRDNVAFCFKDYN